MIKTESFQISKQLGSRKNSFFVCFSWELSGSELSINSEVEAKYWVLNIDLKKLRNREYFIGKIGIMEYFLFSEIIGNIHFWFRKDWEYSIRITNREYGIFKVKIYRFYPPLVTYEMCWFKFVLLSPLPLPLGSLTWYWACRCGYYFKSYSARHLARFELRLIHP